MQKHKEIGKENGIYNERITVDIFICEVLLTKIYFYN